MDRLHAAAVGFRQAVAEQHLGLEGLHISLNGRGELTHRWVADDRRDVFSVSKTFTSIAVGIAQAEGRLHLDDPVLNHLPQFLTDARRRRRGDDHPAPAEHDRGQRLPLARS